jgi:uncharacterized membrane protein YbhN (UPF0104 family)
MALPWLVGVPALVAAAVAGYRLHLPLAAPVRRASRELGFVLGAARRLLVPGARGRFGALGILLFWAGDMLCLWSALRSFGVAAPLAPLVVVYATAYLTTVLPLPIGTIGAAEASLAFALEAVGLRLAPCLLGVVFYGLFSFWGPTVPGLAALAALPWISRRLDALRPSTRVDRAPAAADERELVPLGI